MLMFMLIDGKVSPSQLILSRPNDEIVLLVSLETKVFFSVSPSLHVRSLKINNINPEQNIFWAFCCTCIKL